MNRFLSTSLIALTVGILPFSANATDLGGKGDPTSADYKSPPSFTGFYAGGQIGYGIASQTVTTLSTEHFAATPSRCYAEAGLDAADTYDHDGDATTDELPVVAYLNGGIAVIGMTAEECADEIGAPVSGSGPLGPNASYNYQTGYDPAVAAHDITTRTVGEGSDSGFVGGFQAGYDHQIGSRLVLGVFGDFNWSEIADKNTDWTVGGRVGFLLDPRLMVYGLGGYTQADYAHGDYQGWTVGAGLEYALDRHVFVGASYRYTDLDEETLVDTPDLNVKSDIDEHTILVDLKIKMNTGLGF